MDKLPSEVTQDARVLALISYGGSFFGLPLFLFPLLTRKDEFSIHHAKQATEIYLISMVIAFLYLGISLFTLGLGTFCCMPIVFLPYISGIHGVLLSLNGEWRAPIGVFGVVDSMLGGIRAEK